MQEPLHRCIMVQHWEYCLINSSVGGEWVGGIMPVNIKHKLYKFIHVSILKTQILSVGIFFFLKDPNRWFLPPKLYTFMFGHQPSMEVNTRPKVICCSMSWWPKVHTATSWIAIAPGTFVDLVIHHLSSALPHLPCHLSNKIKRWHKNVS